MSRQCITHHHGCDCREEMYKQSITERDEIIQMLEGVLKSIASHYGQRPDDREIARVYEDMAYDALTKLEKWRENK